jgi:hypothetical protein
MKRANELHNQLLLADQYGTVMGLPLFHVVCSDISDGAKWVEKAVEQRDTRMILLVCLLRASEPNILQLDSRWSDIASRLRIPVAVFDD